MTKSKKEIGQTGEDLAVTHLTQKGYRVVERNYRHPRGEIDIIAKDGTVLCFIEVKMRQSDRLGHPFEAITLAKQRQISRMAERYLQAHRITDVPCRFDVLAITWDSSGPNFDLLKNAFEY